MPDMLKTFVRIFFFFIIFFNHSVAIPQHELTVGDDLPTIRTTYSQVSRFVEGLEDLVERSIKPKKDSYQNMNLSITYEFGSTDLKIADNSIKDLLNDPRLPNPAYTFQIIKSGYKDAISFEIYFKETYSHYEVKGSDSGLVEAIQKHIDSFGQKNQSFIGSTTFRWFLLFFIILLCLFVPAKICSFIAHKWPNLFGIRGSIDFNRQPSDYPVLSLSFFTLFFICVGMGFYFLNSTSDTWFSKTKIYLNSAGYLQIYSGEIAIIFGLLSLLLWFFPRQKKPLHLQ